MNSGLVYGVYRVNILYDMKKPTGREYGGLLVVLTMVMTVDCCHKYNDIRNEHHVYLIFT